MKLSSAFDETLLLNGCSGRQSPVLDEVASAVGTDISYLDKSNSMKLIESFDYVPVESFNGIFSLSDESGINTIAYGGAGTIYGCYNYSSENIASYSKTYAGSTIFASAYAVAVPETAAQGDPSNPASDSNTLAKQDGILIGASADGLHVYSETSSDEGAVKTWNTLRLEGMPDAEIYGVFSAGTLFFISSSAGLAVFDANAVDRSASEVYASKWSFIDVPEWLKDASANLAGISFIRKVQFEIGTAKAEAYAVGCYTGEGDDRKGAAALMGEDGLGWHFVELQWDGTSIVSDVVAVNNASFPDLVSRGSGYERTSDYGEDIPLLNTRSISVMPMAKAEDCPPLDTDSVMTLQALRLKTSEGYAVLAVLDQTVPEANFSNVENVDLQTDRGKESVFTYHEVIRGGRKEYHWVQRKPWAVLDCNDPLPLSLTDGMLYRVAPSGANGAMHARWIETYESYRRDEAVQPAFPSASDLPDTLAVPDDAIVLKNDQISSGSVTFTVDITNYLASYLGTSKRLKLAYVCIAVPNSEFNDGDIYYDIANPNKKWKYSRVSGEENSYDWSAVSASSADANAGSFDISSNSETVAQAYKLCKVKMPDDETTMSRSFGKTVVGDRTVYALDAEAVYDEDDHLLNVKLTAINFEIPYFDINVKMKLVVKTSSSSSSSSSSWKYLKYLVKSSGDNLKWNAYSRIPISTYSELFGRRIMYSQTGTFFKSETDEYIGNRVQCSLTISNSGDWFYSMRPADRTEIRKLKGTGEEFGIFRKQTFTAPNGSQFTKYISVGTASLASNGTLRFAKSDKASTAALISDPQMEQNGSYSSFLAQIPWKKTIGSSAENLSGILELQISQINVTDANIYEDRWTEDFVDCPYVQIQQGETKFFAEGQTAYSFTKAMAENGTLFSRHSILNAPENAVEYAFDYEGRNGLGCISRIAFDESGNPFLDSSYRYLSAPVVEGYARILGKTFFCTVSDTASWTNDAAMQNAFISCASECLNFSSASDAFYRFTPKDSSIAADDAEWAGYAGIKSVCTVKSLSSGQKALRVRYEKCAENAVPQKNQNYRQFSLESGIPVWIEGDAYWLEIAGAVSDPSFVPQAGGTVLADILYQLVLIRQESDLDAVIAAYAENGESPSSENADHPDESISGGQPPAGDSDRFARRQNLWRTWVGQRHADYVDDGPKIQLGGIYSRLFLFQFNQDSTGSIPWTVQYEEHLNSFQKLGSLAPFPASKEWVVGHAGRWWIARFSRSAATSELTTAVSTAEIYPASSLSLSQAVAACTMYYAPNSLGYGDYERRLSFNGTDAMFREVVFGEASIVSRQQYAVLKQWRLEPNPPMKLVARHLASAANPNVNGTAWKLYEEELSAEGRQIWTEWQMDQYEGSRIPLIRNAEDWPAFIPSIGTVYYVDTDHTTAYPKYTAGYYVYHTTGTSVAQCYAKLPGFGTRQKAYISGTSEYKANWRDWTSSTEASYVLVVGRTESDGSMTGRGWMAKVGLDNAGRVGVYGDWLDIGSFKTAGSDALPNASSIMGASIGTGDSERDIAVCFTVRANNGGSSEYETVNSFKIARKYSFRMPCLAGMFELASGSAYYGVSERLDKVGRGGTGVWNEVNETYLTSEYSLPPTSMSVLGRSASNVPASWEWTASVLPRKVTFADYGDFWIVGAYGYTTAAYPEGTQVRTTLSAIVYAKNINAASQNGTGAMPMIKRPNLAAEEGTEDGCGVLWNRQGFHVKFRWSDSAVNGAIGFDPDLASGLSGSESMASKRAIKAMTAIKAYNAPIVFGLYERGGLILYYGQKCFDMSILSESRIGELGTSGEEGSLSWHIEKEAQDIADSLFIPYTGETMDISEDVLAEARRLQKKGAEALNAWMPADYDNLAALAARFGSGESGKTAVADKMERAAGRKADPVPDGTPLYWNCAGGRAYDSKVTLPDRLESVFREMAVYCFRREARSRLLEEADAKLIQSCEYSVNNSSTSQWIDIPILCRNEDGSISEPKEDLATLSTTASGGRIRVFVGSKAGNVYWRDLNPLHADRYISYIPVPFLSQNEQSEIASQAGLDYDKLGTAGLKAFISGSGSSSASSSVQALSTGWTAAEWRYGGLQPIADQNRFAALQNSSAKIFTDAKQWLYADGTDLNIKLTAAQAQSVTAGTNPYVRTRTWKWRIGDVETSVNAYANAPVVEKNPSKNNELWWKLNGTFRAKYSRSMLPTIVERNGTLYWQFGTPPNSVGTAVTVKKNGTPYVQDGEWLVVQNGASAPTKLGVFGSGSAQMQAEPGEAIDEWAVDGRSGIVHKTAAKTTASVKFTVKAKQFWQLVNVKQIKDNGTSGASGTFTTGHELRNGESQKDCPYVLAPVLKAVIDSAGETPVWKTHSAASTGDVILALNKNLFIMEDGGQYVLASADSSSTHRLGTGSTAGGAIPYWIGKSGKDFWISADRRTVGEYCTDASPVSAGGARWMSTSNEIKASDRKTAYFDMWDLPANAKASMKTGVTIVFKTIGGAAHHTRTWTDAETYAKDIDLEIFNWRKANPAGSTARTERKYWAVGDYVLYCSGSTGRVSKTYSDNADLLTDAWQRPSFKCAIWKWRLKKRNGKYNAAFECVSTSAACPYAQVEEICVWKDGTAIDGLDAAQNISLETVETDAWHWFADGRDLNISCLAPNAKNAFKDFRREPVWTGSGAESRCQFSWSVWNGSSWVQNACLTSVSASPLTKCRSKKWAARDANGKITVLNRLAQDALAGKGLETDGIASRNASSQIWNTKTEKWEAVKSKSVYVWSDTAEKWIEGEEETVSWTPLASVFVDAYKEVSKGVLGSIRNPYVNQEGMLWEMIPSTDLFGEEGVTISDTASNGWKMYQESDSGNKTGNSFTVHIGYKANSETGLWDNYCAIVSDSTGSIHRWSLPNRTWKFEHLELVCRSDGTLDRIVIMGSFGWIVASGQISFANEGKDIRGMAWQNPVNPVEPVLQELEKVQNYKWNSWTSSPNTEFAAVGSYGVYVYSADCVVFEASIPYGMDAILSEVVWDPETGEFVIHAIAPTSGSGEETDTVEWTQDEGVQDFEDVHSENTSTKADESPVLVSTLVESGIYTHSHKTVDGKSETRWYRFSSALTSFEEIADPSASEKKNAQTIVPDNIYKWTQSGKTWCFVYSKYDAKGNALGAGYTGKGWMWKWGRKDASSGASGSLSYITISKNMKDVAYGFPDLIRFIRSYKNTYTESMEFVGGVGTFISAERESVDENRKALMEPYKELAEMGGSGLGMYSGKLQIAYTIYLKAKQLRDASHYAPEDCYNTYLQRIGQSLALEYKDFFNRAKRSMWTAQAFRNHYEKLAKKGK